tara:strand:+ start:30771 stop:31502 length:732 start_codon:yes stop_codon:yes gene_type:complete
MIEISNFSKIFVANWKLNGNFEFIDKYFNQIKIPDNDNNCIIVCPTSIYIDYLSRKKNNRIFTGAQNVSSHKFGAYTGEISVNSLKELNVNFCIVGHSERRNLFNETNNDIKLKSAELISNQIVPIICIGEKFDHKESGKTNQFLAKQLDESIPESSNSKNTIIAYEPVWSIGSGLTPSLEEINETHDFIRKLSKKFLDFKILYGGSVKAENSSDINSLSNVDGLLIGGASLKTEEFTRIITD